MPRFSSSEYTDPVLILEEKKIVSLKRNLVYKWNIVMENCKRAGFHKFLHDSLLENVILSMCNSINCLKEK